MSRSNDRHRMVGTFTKMAGAAVATVGLLFSTATAVFAGGVPAGAAHAAPNVATQGCGLVPLDVEIIIDRTGSMGANISDGHTRLYWAQKAADQLVDSLAANGGVGSGQHHHVGVTSFHNTSAAVAIALGTSSATSVKAAIDALTASGNTPLAAGMSTGAGDMTSHGRTTDFGLPVKHVIIIMSDGRPWPDSAPARPSGAQVTAFKNAADAVYSIAIGTGGTSGTSNEVDLALMASLANPSGNSYHVVQASDLPALFADIFTQIACPAHLTLVKQVAGDGQASASDWTLYAKDGDQTVLSGDGGATGDVPAGSYDLSESDGPAHYDAGAWSCDGGSLKGSTVTLAEGATATCTITNTYNPPPPPPAHLTLVKHVAGDGQASADDWTLYAKSGDQTVLSGAGGASGDVPAGTYDLSESDGPAHYDASAWQCDGGDLVDDSVTLAAGESATCTITNRYNPPPPVPGALIVTKTLAGDLTGFAGGDFTFSVVCGETNYGPITINLSSGSKSAAAITDIPAGAECTVTETDKADPGQYASWDDVAAGHATISEDEQSEVIITNTRAYNPPSPTGSVGSETGKPRVTPPSTSTFGGRDGTTGTAGIFLVLAIFALLATILVTTPRRLAIRVRRRDER